MNMWSCDHKNKKIILYPDFSSSGVWCECGAGFGDPIKKFTHVPEGVFELVQLWNNYWDDVSFKDHPSYLNGVNPDAIDYHQYRINKMGRELSKIISRYHPCSFDEENSMVLVG